MLIACRSMYMRVTYEITNKYRVHACTRPDRYIYLLLRRKEKGTSDFGTNYKFPCMIRFKKYVPYVIHGERIVRVSGLNFGKKMKAKSSKERSLADTLPVSFEKYATSVLITRIFRALIRDIFFIWLNETRTKERIINSTKSLFHIFSFFFFNSD